MTKKPNGYWRDISNVVAEARAVMEEHGLGRLPNKTELGRLGYSSLATVITRYHGGFRRFRETLGEEETTKPKGYWQDLDNAVAQARKVMEEHDLDSLPSQRELRRLGHSSLPMAMVKYHGGITAFRELLYERMTGISETDALEGLLQSYIENG